MSSDDKSKKDDQGSGSSQQQDESKPVVYLFPEHSVYDLEPIVVPDSMRLDAGKPDEPDPESEKAADQSEDDRDQQDDRPQKQDEGVQQDSQTSQQDLSWEEQVRLELIREEMAHGKPVRTDESPAEPASEQESATTAETQESSSVERTIGSEPAPVSTVEADEEHEHRSPDSPGRAKIQARKIKATAEQFKIAQDRILKDRIDLPQQAQSRIEQTRAELEAKQAQAPDQEGGKEWNEHASAVLEHFGWVEDGWGPPRPTDKEQSSSTVAPTTDPQTTEPTPQPEQVADHANNGARPENAEEEFKDDDLSEEAKCLFPEHSVFDLEPIVVPDNQRLGPSVTPGVDPRKTGANQKLSPIKINKFRPGKARRQEAERSIRDLEQNTTPKSQIQKEPLTTSAPAEEAHASASETSQPTIQEQHQGQADVGASSQQDPVPEVESEPVVEEQVMEAPPSESIELKSEEEQVENAASAAAEAEQNVIEQERTVSEHEPIAESPHPGEEPTQSVSQTGNSQPATEAQAQSPIREEGWQERTGWEEVVSKQERWQEQTGWEEATENSDWERTGWSQESPSRTAEQAERTSSDTTSGAISEPIEEQRSEEPVADIEDSQQMKRLKTVETLFASSDDEDDEDFSDLKKQESEIEMDVDSQVLEDFADINVGTKTLELESADREELDRRFATTSGDESQLSFEPPATEHDMIPAPPAERAEQTIPADLPVVEGSAEPPVVTTSPGNQFASQEQEEQEEKVRLPEREFDINRIGIETADIDQIILEHHGIELTLGSGGLDETEFQEEELLREVLKKEQTEQSESSTETQSVIEEIQTPGAPEQAPPEQDAPEPEETYDEEDALQEFRPTDSIYELAPFVLPSAPDRLVGEEAEASEPASPKVPVLPKTVSQIMRAAEIQQPERAAVPSAYSDDPLVGTVLAHSYEILDIIGQGGMAIVYRAKQIATGRLVAIKTLRNPNPPDLLRFSQEIKTHSQLNHPNVVGFIDSINARGQLFLVMERVRGISLQEIIRTLGKLDDPENIVEILAQILNALEYAHAGGLIHRDLKTGNIILIKEEDKDMVVKILDFGIAKVQGDLQRLTHVGQALGSPIYMSPEQCSGKTLSTRSDLYSLGVVAYETVTGTPPYSKGTLINVMAAHCNENIKPKPLSEVASHLPKHKMLDQILQKALQTHPDKRWQSAIEFTTALQFWLKSVREDAKFEELPVELQRCPVTEFDLDKLTASANDMPAPSIRTTQADFAWAPAEQEVEDEPVHGWRDTGGWDSSRPQQQPIPGWGEQAEAQSDSSDEPWGHSDKSRQSASATGESANLAKPTQMKQSGAHQVRADLSLSNDNPVSPSQAETGDLWSSQHEMQARRQRPVRNLPGGSGDPKDPGPSLEVQTSVDMNALGGKLPHLTTDEKQDIRSIASTGSLQRALNDPDSRTTSDAPPEGPVDLRRRQAPQQPQSKAQQFITMALIVLIAVTLTFLLSVYYFIQNPDYVQKKFNAIQEALSGGKAKQTAPESTAPAPEPGPLARPAAEEPSRGTEDSAAPSENSEAPRQSTSVETIAPANTLTSEEPQPASEVETRAPSSDRAAAPSDSAASSADNTKSDTETPKKVDEPIPFKKGEPEEGIDF